jgi:hypothetical protein
MQHASSGYCFYDPKIIMGANVIEAALIVLAFRKRLVDFLSWFVDGTQCKPGKVAVN